LSNQSASEIIEILPVSLLNEQRSTVDELRDLAAALKLDFGWHYLLDLTWILSRLGAVQGRRIIDAGAGTGVMQWHLAEHGAEVLSIDRGSRADLPLRFRRRYNVRGLRSAPQADLNPVSVTFRSGKLTSQTRELARYLISARTAGQVLIYNQDLSNLREVADGSVDAVVAVSALEHNPPENLPQVVQELTRVIRPGGLLLATLGAARDQDWYHTPSSGWCYTAESLRRLFDLPADTPDTYAHYDELFQELRDCAELRDHLARFYFKSGDNGMPWGKWDPQYQPVGVCKVKRPAVAA
jgi:ubiquinone/menaquinone biosynthesis C-methylase UbiE